MTAALQLVAAVSLVVTMRLWANVITAAVLRRIGADHG